MEVHHHPDLHHKQKHFKEYLLEFIMIFLAVTLGFFAESWREHISEHERAKEYARALLNDLRNDTADIKMAMRYEEKTICYIDTLVNFANSPGVFKNSGKLYFYMKLASWSYTIDWSTATTDQLLNSGNLRYFSDQELQNKISEYNTTRNVIRYYENGTNSARSKAATVRDEILNAKNALAFESYSMNDIIAGHGYSSNDSLINSIIPLQKEDPDLLNNCVNALAGTVTNRNFSIKIYDPQAIKEATEIIELLKKEYNLK